MTTTARSGDWLKKRGWIVANVEKFNSFIKMRFDAFGIGDLLAAKPGTGISLIQCTTGSNASSHVLKALQNKNLSVWLRSGGAFEIHSFEKQGPRGKRKLWTLRRQRAMLLGDTVCFEETAELPPEPDGGLEPVDRGIGVEVIASKSPDGEVRR